MSKPSTPARMEKLDESQTQVLDLQQNGLPSKKFKTVFSFATPLDWVILVISCFLAIVAGAVNPLLAVLYGQLAGSFDRYQSHSISGSQLRSDISRFSLYFVYLTIGTFGAVYISTVGFYYSGERITKSLRRTYLKTIIRQNIAYFDNLGSGELTTRITSDISLIQDGITGSLALFLTAAATFISAFVIAFIEYWKLALVLCPTIVVMTVIGGAGIAYPVKFTKQALGFYGRGATVLEEAISSIRHVTAFGIQENMVQRYDSYLKQATLPALKGSMGIALAVSVLQAVPYLTYGLAFWEGSRLLVRGEMTVASVTTTTLAMIIGSWTIGRVSPNARAFYSSIASASKILESSSRKSPEDPFSEQGKRLEHGNLDIKFRNVQLVYPSRREVTVLKDLNLLVPAYKTTAIVGASGCGKSSIIGLLERFYKPTKGEILLGTDDIQTLNLNWLRSQLSLVSQEPTLFNATIFENIAYGLEEKAGSSTPDALKTLVEEAARTANAHDFISRLPQGYQTTVGEKGIQLSGGQRQRICIARAVIKNPRILLLDEATSALDVEAERSVQAALAAAAKGRTTIVIAHRLSTVRDADNIVVMADGHIVEQGPHDDLIAQKGFYAELMERQHISNEVSNLEPDTKSSSLKSGMDAVSEKEKSSDFKVADSKATSIAVPSKPAATPQKPGFSWGGVFSALGFILRVTRPETMIIIVAALLTIVAGLAVPGQSIIFAKLLDALSISPASALRHTVNFWSLMYLAMALGLLVVWLGQSTIFAFTTEKLIHRSREQSFRHVLRQEIAFFDEDRNSIGALTSLLTTGPTGLNGLGGVVVSANLNFIPTIVGGIILSLIIAWKLALVCTATIPIVAGFGWVRLAMLTLFAEKTKKSHADSAAYASEATSAIRTVASLNMEHRVLKRYDDILEEKSRESLKSILSASSLYAASQSVTFLCAALAFWYGGTLIANEHYTVFQFFVCFAALISGAQRAGLIFSYATGMSKAISSARDLRALFDRPSMIDTWNATGNKVIKEDCAGEIEFRNVSFSYSSRAERVVIDHLNVNIRPGQYVALVGPSGCGKSTFISLLERFYDPTAGQIMVDGQDISKLNVNDYRSVISVVGQEPTLYSGTIRDNLILGSSDTVSEEEIVQACKEANIYDFIVSLPNGFATEVGSKGVMLSGGQKQRMAIARAVLRNTKILLLDEATAALDSVSEEVVQDALNKASKRRTTIAVAHRLSTIRNADVIYVLNEGRLVEAGNHRDLMRKEGGVYRGLVEMQNSVGTDEKA